MCVVQIILPDSSKLYVIAVYLPHQTCEIADFKQELGILEKIIANCHNDGSVLVIGDTNLHLGPECGVRGWGKTYSNGHLFMNTMNIWVVDIGIKGRGPIYTYQSNVGSSYIDLVCVSRDLLNKIKFSEVITDDIHNISNHLAVSATLTIPEISHVHSEGRQQVAWDRLTEDDMMYICTLPLEII